MNSPPHWQFPPPCNLHVAIFSGPGLPWSIRGCMERYSKPIVGHLDPYFIQVMSDVQQLLKPAYGMNEGATLVISGTGSAGMEAAISNFVEAGTQVCDLCQRIFFRSAHGDGETPGRECGPL